MAGAVVNLFKNCLLDWFWCVFASMPKLRAKASWLGQFCAHPFRLARRKSTGVRRLLTHSQSAFSAGAAWFMAFWVSTGSINLPFVSQPTGWSSLAFIVRNSICHRPTAPVAICIGLLLPARTQRCDDRGENIIGLILSEREVNRLPCAPRANFESKRASARSSAKVIKLVVSCF